MYEKVYGPRAVSKRLYAEFAQFYNAQRCRWAPDNPLRVFNLAFKRIYPPFRNQLSEEQMLAVVYATLGYRGADKAGLFETFDPAKYRGSRRLEDHFVSLFGRKLTGRLKRAARPRTDTGRPGNRDRFRTNPALGLLDERLRPASEQDRLDILPAVLACLDARERGVIHLRYWGNLSARKVGALLAMDHRTVARLHDSAVRKLRRLYGVDEVEENLAA